MSSWTKAFFECHLLGLDCWRWEAVENPRTNKMCTGPELHCQWWTEMLAWVVGGSRIWGFLRYINLWAPSPTHAGINQFPLKDSALQQHFLLQATRSGQSALSLVSKSQELHFLATSSLLKSADSRSMGWPLILGKDDWKSIKQSTRVLVGSQGPVLHAHLSLGAPLWDCCTAWGRHAGFAPPPHIARDLQELWSMIFDRSPWQLVLVKRTSPKAETFDLAPKLLDWVPGMMAQGTGESPEFRITWLGRG